MSKTVSIDPATRVEGHLNIRTEEEKGVIRSAQVGGRMYRGFEHLLLGRHPVDAIRITQRICGICHEVHGIASIRAIEQLYGITPPRNAELLRDAILALHIVTDHLMFFYQLCLPDYIDAAQLKDYKGDDPKLVRLRQWLQNTGGGFARHPSSDGKITSTSLTAELLTGYLGALDVRRQAGKALALLGGKVPFMHALIPGGLTTRITPDIIMGVSHAVKNVYDFVHSSYLPHTLELARFFPGGFSLGGSHGRFLSFSTFKALSTPLFPGRIETETGADELDLKKIHESFDGSFFSEDGAISPQKPDAYSWIRALHYNGQPMEVGPLSRLLARKDKDLNRLSRQLGGGVVRSSLLHRLLARAIESKILCEHALGTLESYRFDALGLTRVNLAAPLSGHGTGICAASRGDLLHEIVAEKGKIVQYRLRVPSSWNFSPRAGGINGTVEEALIGTKVANNTALLSGRIVRSFDPCLACAVH